VANIMKDEVNLRDQIANAPASVLGAASLATMIAYEPDRTADLVRAFRADLPRLVADVVGYPGGNPAALAPIVWLLGAAGLVTDAPTISVSAAESGRPVTVTMSSVLPGARVRYTLDGSTPDDSSAEYAGPFTLGRTAEIRARSFAPDLVTGFGSGAMFRLTFAKSVSYAVPNNPKYDGGGPMALADGRFGDADNFRKGWVGFQGDDLSATVELDTTRDLRWIGLRCLESQRNWIFLPGEVTIEVSRDGRAWQTAARLDTRSESLTLAPAPAVRTLGAGVKTSGTRFVRITAKNPGTLPDWHPSAGEKSWVFADEIIVE
jgi:hexosaminidase